MQIPAKSPLMRAALAAALAAIIATPLTAPALAQNIDLSVILPNVEFPKEGAFQSPEAKKKLPGEQFGQRQFLLKAPVMSQRQQPVAE